MKKTILAILLVMVAVFISNNARAMSSEELTDDSKVCYLFLDAGELSLTSIGAHEKAKLYQDYKDNLVLAYSDIEEISLETAKSELRLYSAKRINRFMEKFEHDENGEYQRLYVIITEKCFQIIEKLSEKLL
jgi:hypothetical protein